MQNQFEILFNNSFDNFKAFDNLNLAEACNLPANAPKSIWQILNHLIIWQSYQLGCLKNADLIDIDEQETWVNTQAINQDDVDSLVEVFKTQHRQIATAIAKLNISDPHLQSKLKIIQELSVHLSFHLGEVILMRRIAGTYPLPHQ
jgi:predicted thioredoxin/glutaredoxin